MFKFSEEAAMSVERIKRMGAAIDGDLKGLLAYFGEQSEVSSLSIYFWLISRRPGLTRALRFGRSGSRIDASRGLLRHGSLLQYGSPEGRC